VAGDQPNPDAPDLADHATGEALATFRFVDAGHNVVMMGPVGVGDMFLATALGHAAVRRRYSVH
jgi:DNA replication protein DnaC